MKSALITYHIVNILHLLFYAAIFLSLINAFGSANLMKDFVYYLIGTYVVLYFGLNFFARRVGDGMANPIVSVKLANWLHAGSIVVFALSFYLYYRVSHDYVYLMLVSFPMDIFAVVLAYRAYPIEKRESDMLDE
jgi:hypothetical protein